MRGNIGRALDVAQRRRRARHRGRGRPTARTTGPMPPSSMPTRTRRTPTTTTSSASDAAASTTPINALVNMVHPVNRSDIFDAPDDIFGELYLNAFYCGECAGGVMVYGEGLPGGVYLSSTGQFFDYFSGALDVVAHELTHGVTTTRSHLEYVNESGRAQRGVLGHHGHERRVLLSASRNGPAESRLPDRRRHRPRGAARRARWIPVDGQPRALRPARSLQQARGAAAGRGQRQRRRPHQLRHSEPRVLPRHRGGHEPHVRHSRAGRRRLESRADREGLLSRASRN